MIAKNEYLIIDTGFFVALGNKRDQYHQKAIKILKILPKRKWITTWPILTEVCHMLLNAAPDKIVPFLKNLEMGVFSVFDLTENNYGLLRELMNKYSDLPMDLADASLVVLANHLKQGDILSTDCRDFRTYRWKNHTPFNNLFEAFTYS